MRFLNRLYLVKVFQRSKLLFLLCLVFIAGQSYYVYLEKRNTPFQMIDMYSGHFTNPDNLDIHEIWINDKRLDLTSLSFWREAILLYPLNYYQVSDNFDTPEKLKDKIAYEKWLVSYLQNLQKEKIEHLVIEYPKYFINGIHFTKSPETRVIYEYTSGQGI